MAISIVSVIAISTLCRCHTSRHAILSDSVVAFIVRIMGIRYYG